MLSIPFKLPAPSLQLQRVLTVYPFCFRLAHVCVAFLIPAALPHRIVSCSSGNHYRRFVRCNLIYYYFAIFVLLPGLAERMQLDNGMEYNNGRSALASRSSVRLNRPIRE